MAGLTGSSGFAPNPAAGDSGPITTQAFWAEYVTAAFARLWLMPVGIDTTVVPFHSCSTFTSSSHHTDPGCGFDGTGLRAVGV